MLSKNVQIIQNCKKRSATSLGIPPIDLEIKRRAYNYWLRKGDNARARDVLPGLTGFSKSRVFELWEERLQSETHITKEMYGTVQNRLNSKLIITSEVVQIVTGCGSFKDKLHKYLRSSISLI